MIQVQPGNVEVSSIASRVSSGEVVSHSPTLFLYPMTCLSRKIYRESTLTRNCLIIQTVVLKEATELRAVDHQGLPKLRISIMRKKIQGF